MPTQDNYSLSNRLYRPNIDADDLFLSLVHFHNGMFVVGRVTTHNVLCRKLRVLTRHTTVLVYQRLVSGD